MAQPNIPTGTEHAGRRRLHLHLSNVEQQSRQPSRVTQTVEARSHGPGHDPSRFGFLTAPRVRRQKKYTAPILTTCWADLACGCLWQRASFDASASTWKTPGRPGSSSAARHPAAPPSRHCVSAAGRIAVLASLRPALVPPAAVAVSAPGRVLVDRNSHDWRSASAFPFTFRPW